MRGIEHFRRKLLTKREKFAGAKYANQRNNISQKWFYFSRRDNFMEISWGGGDERESMRRVTWELFLLALRTSKSRHLLVNLLSFNFLLSSILPMICVFHSRPALLERGRKRNCSNWIKRAKFAQMKYIILQKLLQHWVHFQFFLLPKWWSENKRNL